MKTKLLVAAAIAALSLGAGAAQAQTATDQAVTEAKVSFYFGFYGSPYYGGYYGSPYYGGYYGYYGPYCKWHPYYGKVCY